MKFDKEKFFKIFYPVFYLFFAIGVAISGCLIFSKYYYTNIYISGVSMNPTLLGDGERCHYGIADTSNAAIDATKRFDVIITYYTWSESDTTLKVKRVWGLPGETISLKAVNSDPEDLSSPIVMDFSVKHGTETVYQVYSSPLHNYTMTVDSISRVFSVFTFNVANKTFNINVDGNVNARSFMNHTLAGDEYFVMGDNWTHSTDCYGNSTARNLHNLNRRDVQGRVIRIEGTAKYSGEAQGLVNKSKFLRPLYNF